MHSTPDGATGGGCGGQGLGRVGLTLLLQRSGPDAGLPVMKNPHEAVAQKGTLSNRLSQNVPTQESSMGHPVVAAQPGANSQAVQEELRWALGEDSGRAPARARVTQEARPPARIRWALCNPSGDLVHIWPCHQGAEGGSKEHCRTSTATAPSSKTTMR